VNTALHLTQALTIKTYFSQALYRGISNKSRNFILFEKKPA